MKKRVIGTILILVFICMYSYSTADQTPPPPSKLVEWFGASNVTNPPTYEFSLRNGIIWGDSEQNFLEKLAIEGFQNPLNIHDELVVQFPPEAEKNHLWAYQVKNVSLGNDNETVAFIGVGSQKDGLYYMSYHIKPENNKAYNRAKELTASLEKKYGSFKSKGKNEKYQAWKYLDDSTMIFILVQTKEIVTIEYRCPKYEEIEKALQDGSYFVETPFGL